MEPVMVNSNNTKMGKSIMEDKEKYKIKVISDEEEGIDVFINDITISEVIAETGVSNEEEVIARLVKVAIGTFENTTVPDRITIQETIDNLPEGKKICALMGLVVCIPSDEAEDFYKRLDGEYIMITFFDEIPEIAKLTIKESLMMIIRKPEEPVDSCITKPTK